MRLTAAVFAAVFATACSAPAPAKVTPKTDDEKTIYAVGVAIQKSLEAFNLTPTEVEQLIKAAGLVAKT